MTRVSNADHVLLLLQEQLSRLGKEKSARCTLVRAACKGTPEPVTRLRALAGREGISEDDMKRALVRSVLVQQLGEAIGTDPAFEAIASDVMRIIGESDAGRDLLDKAMVQLGRQT
ncbi:MAG: hypothetical protein ABI240_05455 [Sphingomonas sp.]